MLTIAGVNFGYVELGASLGVLLQAERGAVTMQVLQHSDGQIVAKVEQGASGVVGVPQEGGGGSRGFQVTVVVRVGGVGGSGQVQVAKAQMEFVPASGQVALQLSNAAASMLDLYTDASREAFRALVACITARGAGAATCASADAQDICVVEVGLKAEADRNGGKRRQTSARSDVVVTLRFLSAISAPASGVAMLRAFHQALVTCCLNSNALEVEASVSEEILCSPLAVARAGGQVCSDLARLGVLQAVFEKGSLDEAAGAGGGAVTAKPPDSALWQWWWWRWAGRACLGCAWNKCWGGGSVSAGRVCGFDSVLPELEDADNAVMFVFQSVGCVPICVLTPLFLCVCSV
ncbi:MAG: hypothetical protein ACPIOQ_25545 [Promethearchaeia archaeon]